MLLPVLPLLLLLLLLLRPRLLPCVRLCFRTPRTGPEAVAASVAVTRSLPVSGSAAAALAAAAATTAR